MSTKVRGACALLAAILCSGPRVTAAQDAAWAPPVPNESGFDWIQLVSGEWLGGTIKSMRDGSLEFDSDKLDVLTLDWADVKELRSPRTLEYVFDDGRRAAGPAAMVGGAIRIGPDGQEYPASTLLSIVVGATSEWDRWSGNLNVGLVVRSGNTDSREYNALLFLRRETGRTRVDLSGANNYGTLNGDKNVNNQQASARLGVFLTKRLYVVPISASVYADEFQNIDLRTTVSAGLGYDLLAHAKCSWTVGLSAGYLNTNYLSVELGEKDFLESGALIPLTSVEWDPTGDIETKLDYKATLSTETVKDAYHNLVALISMDLTKIFDLTFSVTWDHVETPKRTEDGTLPKRDDFRMTFGVGVDF
jgi:putative salt-induced outer membrane protein YdiY